MSLIPATVPDDMKPIIIFVSKVMLLGDLFPIVFGTALAASCAHYLAMCCDEQRGIRRLVTAGLVLLILHVILAFGDTVRTYGLGFGNVTQVTGLSPVFVTGMCINAITAAMVQSFYAWRCYRLLGNWLLLPFFGIFITFSFGSMVVSEIVAIVSDDPGLFIHGGTGVRAMVFMRLPYIAAIAIDSFLCGFTLLGLYRAQLLGSEQGVARFVKKLALLTVTSFGLTTMVCTVILITSYLSVGVYWSFCLASSDFYMFTLLVWLYSRRSTRIALSSSGGSSQPRSGSSGPHSSVNKGVRHSSHFRSPSGTPIFTNSISVHKSQFTSSSSSNETASSADDFDMDPEKHVVVRDVAPFV